MLRRALEFVPKSVKLWKTAIEMEDEENAKKADDVCEEQKTPYQKKVDKPPNVLRVTVIRAKDLLAVDKKC